MVFNRRRGTAIVEFPEGILVVSQGSESFMLAGGGANKGESRRRATMRELQEETGLKPLGSKYLFAYKSKLHRNYKGGHFRDYHKVFLIKVDGTPTPQREIKRIAFFKEGSGLKLVYSTKEIIEKFLTMRSAEIRPLKCSHCGANLTILDPSEPIKCTYCGTVYTSSINVRSKDLP
jgi:ADP-ribose pyrophosphatase YjhB (NUDIX family)